MEQGESRVVIHESFKDLKTRRAEQEAYRRALDEQIMQKKLLQKQEREKYSAHRTFDYESNTNVTNHPNRTIPTNQNNFANYNGSIAPANFPPLPHAGHDESLRGLHRVNDIDNFNEPHPAAVASSMEYLRDPTTFPPNYFHPPILVDNALYKQQQNQNPTSYYQNPSLPPAAWQPPHFMPPENRSCPQASMNYQCQNPHETIIWPPQTQQYMPQHGFTPCNSNAYEADEHKTPRLPKDSPRTQIPEISPECMKYIQQVMPGFKPPPSNNTAVAFNGESSNDVDAGSATEKACKTTCEEPDTLCVNLENYQAFSSGTSSESSSTEMLQTQKVHVSQTSEQLAGVKISRKQYKAELQRQIDERKRREEELRQKEQEEEEKIQAKIRIDQEKMQREYEEELRKQQEKEIEAEQKRICALKMQTEIDAKNKAKARRGKNQVPLELEDNNGNFADSSTSTETIESIGEFFDTTMKGDNSKVVNPDDRIIPVVAKKLMQKEFEKKRGITTSDSTSTQHEEDEEDGCRQDSRSITARVRSAFPDSMPHHYTYTPETLEPGVLREIAIRSAPCPSTDSTGFGFLSSLKTYLKEEKCKLDNRIRVRTSKSADGF